MSSNKADTSNETGNETIERDGEQQGFVQSAAVVPKSSSCEGMENQLTSQIAVTMNKRNIPQGTIEGQPSKKVCSETYAMASVDVRDAHAVADDSYKELDLCTPEGQVAAAKAESPHGTPGMTWDQAKHAARREYNRVNAARARQRHKDVAETRDQQIGVLQSQIEHLTRLNQVLINYICEIQASPNSQSATYVGPPVAISLLEALSVVARSAAPVGSAVPLTTTNHAESDSEMMSRLKQKQAAEELCKHQSSLAMNHLTQLCDNTPRLRNDRPNFLSDLLRGQALPGTGSLISPITRALQAQQLLAETTKNDNASYPWNATSGVYQPHANQSTNSLWEVLLSMQHLHNLLPSSGAPKSPLGE